MAGVQGVCGKNPKDDPVSLGTTGVIINANF